MEGGMTRKRGYLWLTILCLLATVVVAAIPHRSPAAPPQLPPDAASAALAPQHGSDSSRKNRWQSYTNHSQTSPQQRETSRPAAIPQRKPLVFELNSADSIDLVQLYNIGPTIARRILKYRSLLGGFFCKEQLLEVYGIDSSRFSDIAPYLTVNRSAIVPININTADINRLKRHPYLDYYQAKAIVLMRDANGPYLKVSDILNIPIIDTTTFKRIEPYLSCNSQQNK